MSIAGIAKKGVALAAKNPQEVEKYLNAMAGVLGAAAILIDKAKPLLDEVDADAVVDMAKQAANNVADGVQAFANKAGEGANAAANGINAAAGALGNAVKTLQNAKNAADARKAVNAARQSIFDSAAAVFPLTDYLEKHGPESDPLSGSLDMPGCYLIATYKKHDHDKKYSDYLGIYVGADERMAKGVSRVVSRAGDPDVYADYKFGQNMLLFVYPCEVADLNDHLGLLRKSFDGHRMYNTER